MAIGNFFPENFSWQITQQMKPKNDKKYIRSIAKTVSLVMGLLKKLFLQKSLQIL